MDMIENVAAALTARIDAAPNGSEMRKLLFFERRDLARAAIKAMRLPTESMLKAGEKTFCGPELAGQGWADMIDAALVDKGRSHVDAEA